MSKGQNAFAAGALVLVAAMLRIPLHQDAQPSSSAAESRISSSEGKAHQGEGPWMASCQYWAAVTGAKPGKAVDTLAKNGLKVELVPSGDKVETKVSRIGETQQGCGSEGVGWGIPDHPKKIHMILVAVPDPIHSHLSLEFDREIDAILQAASNYGYLSSNYWLPWRLPSRDASSTNDSAKHDAEDKEREKEPGLIVLKNGPRRGPANPSVPIADPSKATSDHCVETDDQPVEPDDPSEETADQKVKRANRCVQTADYYDVLYLFLVGETPAQGMNGVQLRHALEHEQEILGGNKKEVFLSLSESDSEMAFLGPKFSGSATSLQQGLMSGPIGGVQIVGAGTTSTQTAIDQLNMVRCPEPGSRNCIDYRSFGENNDFEAKTFLANFDVDDAGRTAILAEDNTVFGGASAGAGNRNPTKADANVLYIRFPREISLLRNALGAKGSSGQGQIPSPYLSLQIKDSNADDVIPRFSLQSPASVESQLMEIEHQLQKRRVRKILIAASNILDEAFLAQELHRACPDAAIVFYNGGDLLFERDVDNEPYIGSLAVTPYDLITPDHPAPNQIRIPSDSQGEAVYNAANYVFGYGHPSPLHVGNPFYGAYVVPEGQTSSSKDRFAMRLNVAGTDGYYPLAILGPCASNSRDILPDIRVGSDGKWSKGDLSPCEAVAKTRIQENVLPLLPRTPSLMWFFCCAIVFLVCLAHAVAVWTANFWSSMTRDLAVRENDQPYRRTVYIHLATATLLCMAATVAVPFLSFEPNYFKANVGAQHQHLGWFLAIAVLMVALLAVVVTLERTKDYILWLRHGDSDNPTYLYSILLAFAWFAAAFQIAAICFQDRLGWGHSYSGLFFSYRSLHPASGVSPLPAILLLQAAWYVWAMCQTARLRFSELSRPRLPDVVTNADQPHPQPLLPNQSLYFVSDVQLNRRTAMPGTWLYQNIESFLIVHELIRRYTGWRRRTVALATVGFYAVFFGIVFSSIGVHSLERAFSGGKMPAAYELLIELLSYPLLLLAFSAWLRAVVIWSSLKAGLLEPLERGPLRFAFTRLREVDWVTMLGQSGLYIRWLDMTRALESMRQITNDRKFKNSGPLKDDRCELAKLIQNLQINIGDPEKERLTCEAVAPRDRPYDEGVSGLCYINAIERTFAHTSTILLQHTLIPYWRYHRTGYVKSSDVIEKEQKDEDDSQKDPAYIRHAEEFLAIRYVSLIRMVLVNIRYLMIFVSVVFVLMLVAWNSYPFQPHRKVDWCFTILIVFLSVGFVWIFAQMHRDPILSRITSTEPNRLGWDFFLRLATFGAVPLLTWLAYEFPEIGGKIFQLVQPSLAVK